MQRYRFNWAYRSGLYDAMEGDEAEFDDAMAAALDNDSPGVLSPINDVKVARAVETPPGDRMQRKPQARDDRGGGEAISKNTFKAVKS